MAIKKRITLLSFLLLFSIAYLHGDGSPHTRVLKLESSILEKIDGLSIGIDGETVALIKQYDAGLLNMLIGKRDQTGKRVGMYELEGERRTVQELTKMEDELGKTAELITLRQQIRKDFEVMSEAFRSIARGAKPFMAILIEESCRRRGRKQSILNIWAHTEEAKEDELFDQYIDSIKDLDIFFTDLHNFLNDLIHSCPKAFRQFQEKISKFNKIKKILPELGITQELQILFLRQINKALNTISLDEITIESVRKMFNEFKNKQQ